MSQTMSRSHQRTAALTLTSKELEALHRKLVEERDRMVTEYDRDFTAARSVQEEGMEDFEELAAMDLDREQLFAYSEQDRETLRLIEEALQRMEDGTYGLCLETGKPIPVERLRAIPWARYCANVQSEIELAAPPPIDAFVRL